MNGLSVWTLAGILVALAVGAWVMLRKLSKTQPAAKGESLNTVEQACLETLQLVAGNDCNIRSHVRLSELQPNAGRRAAQHPLSFVLYGKATGRPLCALILQTGDDNKNALDATLAQIGISLIQLPRRSSYAPIYLQEKLQAYIRVPMPGHLPDRTELTRSTL